MNRSNKKPNLTINIYADDQLRSLSNHNNNNPIEIQSNSMQMLYPQQVFDEKNLPSVPVCLQQPRQNEGVDRTIIGKFE